MNTIASFTVDHRSITPGIYISRIDGDITTYDLRTRRPNCGSFMDQITMHTFEHLFATYIRNSEMGPDVVYFGPMGCQTGFYLLVKDRPAEEVFAMTKTVLRQILAHDGPMFGASAAECGNYRNLSVEAAKVEAERYLAVLEQLDGRDFSYPKGENT